MAKCGSLVLRLFFSALFAGFGSAQRILPVNGSGTVNITRIYLEIQSTSFGALGSLRAPNASLNDTANRTFAGDIQFFLPNQTAPLTLVDNETVIAEALTIVSNPTANVTFSERYFQVLNNYTVVYSDVFNAGLPGQNLHFTSAWQKLSNQEWYARFISLAPANASTNVTSNTLPVIDATPANATSNSSQPFFDPTVYKNFTTQPAVGNTAGRLLVDLQNSSISFANISDKYFSTYLQLVLPGVDGPIPFNLTDPTSVGFLSTFRARNASAPAPVAVSYLQLSPEAAVRTMLVRDVPRFGNIYVIQVWELLYNTSWRLSLAAVNIAPPS